MNQSNDYNDDEKFDRYKSVLLLKILIYLLNHLQEINNTVFYADIYIP